jgi:uncharacterized membrane protein
LDSISLYKELRRLRKSQKKFNKKQDQTNERITIMSAELDALALEVAETNTIMQSAVVLIQGLSEQLIAIANDPAAILQLAADLDAQSDALAAAISAAPPLPPVPPAP